MARYSQDKNWGEVAARRKVCRIEDFKLKYKRLRFKLSRSVG